MRLEHPMRIGLELAPYKDFEYPRWSKAAPAGGIWQPGPDTFRVEEKPKYAFCGEGEHAALIVEKVGLATREVAAGVARSLGLPASAVGYAGMKDKASVAVQAFTVTGVSEARAREAFEEQGCRVLTATRHRNKLRLGHLEGNRFRAYLSGTDPVGAEAVVQDLAERGAPNYFGPQRFGARGDNALGGLAALRGETRVRRWTRDLLVSALQSFVFNEVLSRRIEQGAMETALHGDVLRREDSGGLFLCADPLTDTSRVRTFEVSPTGPMPGRKMVHPSGRVLESEAAVLRDLGIEASLFSRERGARRPLRVRIRKWSVTPAEGGAWVEFCCPAGSFATSVIREITG